MAWQIEFGAGAVKDLKKLDPEVAKRIITFLETRIAALENPRSLGAALTGSDLGEL